MQNLYIILYIIIYMQQEVIRIPKERIAVLVGHKGATKKEIEKITGAKLNIDSQTGEIEVIYPKNDGFRLMKAVSVVRAIARGFSPKKAGLLMNDNYTLDLIEVEEIAGKSEKSVNAKKGRVIGEKGRTREKIERETGTYLSVYGKTIGIIGNIENVPIARKAIEMLLEGAMHNTAYTYLENRGKQFELGD